MNARTIIEGGTAAERRGARGRKHRTSMPMSSSPLTAARVIVLKANEKGGVGKIHDRLSSMHGAGGRRCIGAAIDLDRRQQTLSRALLNRETTARQLEEIGLPLPKQQVLQVQSGSMLCQEINRVAWNADVVVVDAAAMIPRSARRAIAIPRTRKSRR